MAAIPESVNFGAVLLAAGGSTRLGQPKQRVKIDGQSLVRRAALQLLALNPVSLTVVTGCSGDAVENDVRDLPLRIAHNDQWDQGMGGSIACGARLAGKEADGLLVVLCDQWRVDENDLGRLVSAWSTDISRIICACWRRDKVNFYGAPALFPRYLIRELINLRGDKGAKSLIMSHRGAASFVTMEHAAYDLDTPADLEQLLRQAGQNPSS
jgi:molybdenum cofactor cytidylyltransferase